MSGNLQSDINVTPLVDVCLVLLIIFMVVTPMINHDAVQLPQSRTADVSVDGHQQIDIAVKEDGMLAVNDVFIRPEQLRGELDRLHRSRAASGGALPVNIRADRRVHYGDVIAVLAAARAAGFDEVGLVGRRPPAT